MTDLERLLHELVVSAREDATDGFKGLSMTTRAARREIREVFTDLVTRRLDPLLEQVIRSAQRDGRSGSMGDSPDTRAALGKVRYAYDDLLPETDEY